MRRITNTLREIGSSDGFLIHIHKYHDLSNGVVIFCVMGKNSFCYLRIYNFFPLILMGVKGASLYF